MTEEVKESSAAARSTESPRAHRAVESAERRLGPQVLARRRNLEGRSQHFGRGKKWIPLQLFEPILDGVRRVMRGLGVYDRAAARATRPVTKRRPTFLIGLPEPLVGLRILHLSDLHIDGRRGMGAELAGICAGLEFDIACITGDLRLATRGDLQATLDEMEPLVKSLAARAPTFAVLGNHDVFDLVAPLERWGVRYLLNESAALEHGGCRFHVAGVDDAHYFGTDDLDKALNDVPIDDVSILLVHSPDLIHEAANACVDFYLCGHTHGGQLCLPGGRAIISNANCRRRFSAGAWRLGALCGYTSRGIGFSGIPLRTFCDPEIIVHVLQRERRSRARLSLEAIHGIDH